MTFKVVAYKVTELTRAVEADSVEETIAKAYHGPATDWAEWSEETLGTNGVELVCTESGESVYDAGTSTTAWNARFQKGGKMALGPWRTGSLHCYGEHHLANCWTAARCLQAAGLINQFDQVQLLSDPHQSAYVANQSGPDRTRQSQIGHRGRICRAQYRLASEGPLLGGIPQRLRSDPISATSHPTLEYVHSSSHTREALASKTAVQKPLRPPRH